MPKRASSRGARLRRSGSREELRRGTSVRRRSTAVLEAFVRPSYRGSTSRTSSSSVSSVNKKNKVGNIIERLEKAERINARLEVKEKEKKFKFSKPGCETQFKFNSKMKDLFGDDLKVELEKHFKEGLPEGIGGLVKEAGKEIDDQNLKLKVADEFGFKAMEEFGKEDLARDEKEEKKIKALRKEKKERQEKGKGHFARPWTARVGSKGFESKGFERRSWKDRGGMKCYSCLGLGHMAKDCVRSSSGKKSGK